MKLSKTYEPHLYEADIYALWEKAEAFAPRKTGDPYSIVVPPPNANGNLHLGHALTLGLEDIAVRYHRMKGDRALLVPGADHAGFETQVVYEKKLAEQGKSRFDYSREELYDQIWDFVAENKENYESQFRRLGASVDWATYTYTLDEKVVKRAYATFKKMWDEGLVYRGERLVNYCTHHRTGFADIEVAYEDATTPLYYLKYGPFTLATTRPETKFGDTAVAVHPDDKRYKEYVNKVITVEGVNGPFEVMVIADEMVDPNFGTGVVKITPAHSFDDWEVAQRHNLPAVRVINHDGTMNERAGQFRGMPVLEARKAVVAVLKEKGLLVKVDEKYQNRVGKCYKCGTLIEPMLMDQWFIDMKPLAGPAIEALEKKKITFYPDTKRQILIDYYKNLKDWNISRQIAWGIPIPAFQNVDDGDDWIYDERVGEEFLEIDGKTYRRDPDVFDTWFSSSSWPYATLDYPDSPALKDMYPLSVMETGADLLQPWVSRMIMFGLYVTGEVPFKAVYFHGMVLDEKGQKMSKSKGNVINPMDKIEVYGSDALRMGLITGQSAGSNQPFGEPKLVGARNFGNKLWNVARFVENLAGEGFTPTPPTPQTAADHWVLDRLSYAVTTATAQLEDYRFSEAYDTQYHFIWDDFADWYIEASKAQPNIPLLAFVLEQALALTHPFAPFLTETIWQALGWRDSLLITESWPQVVKADKKQARAFEEIKTVVAECRYIITALKTREVTLYHKDEKFLEDNKEVIIKMARLRDVVSVEDGKGLKLTETSYNCWLDIDMATAQAFISELDTKITEQNTRIAQLEGRLANKAYVKNAPKHLVDETREALEAAKALLSSISEERKRFSGE